MLSSLGELESIYYIHAERLSRPADITAKHTCTWVIILTVLLGVYVGVTHHVPNIESVGKAAQPGGKVIIQSFRVRVCEDTSGGHQV